MGELILEAVTANRLLRRVWYAILAGVCLASGPAWLGLGVVTGIFAFIELMDYIQRR